MRIELTQGYYTEIDPEDYEAVSIFKWGVLRTKQGTKLYAQTIGGSKKPLLMHRLILRANPFEEVDHKDGDGLNNTRENLRIATRSQNSANRYPSKGYKGVHLLKQTGRYQAGIKFEGHKLHLGYYDTPEEAALAYNQKAQELFGEFARLNDVGV